MGHVALPAAGHKKFGARIFCFFQDQCFAIGRGGGSEVETTGTSTDNNSIIDSSAAIFAFQTIRINRLSAFFAGFFETARSRIFLFIGHIFFCTNICIHLLNIT